MLQDYSWPLARQSTARTVHSMSLSKDQTISRLLRKPCHREVDRPLNESAVLPLGRTALEPDRDYNKISRHTSYGLHHGGMTKCSSITHALTWVIGLRLSLDILISRKFHPILLRGLPPPKRGFGLYSETDLRCLTPWDRTPEKTSFQNRCFHHEDSLSACDFAH
jgi:hypothetical protein